MPTMLLPTSFKKMAGPLLSLLLLLLLSPLTLSDPPSSLSADAQALLKLKATLVLPDPDPLADWSPSAPNSPCHGASPWPSILCNKGGSVESLRLVGLNLSGAFKVDPLRGLRALRSVSLNNNNFSGPIPDFTSLGSLKSIYISNNGFSGDIPDDFFASVDHLKKLWIDGNAFTGPVPSSLSKLSVLQDLHFENNKFTGPLPDMKLPLLTSFSAANNGLDGPIPAGLAKKFNSTAFAGNPGLCGPPLDTPCDGGASSSGEGSALLSGEKGDGDGGESSSGEEEVGEAEKKGGGGGGSSGVIAVLAVVVFGGLIAGAIIAAKSRGSDDRDFNVLESDTEAMEAAAAVEASQKQVSAAGGGRGGGEGSSHRRGGSNRGSIKRGAGGGGGMGGADLVMVNEERGVFGLPDLMKAAAEVLGNGGLGSAYKAVMGSGLAVAVKRMRELNRVTKEVFDVEMRKYGRLRHRNVLPPLAYLYRREEKLVVSEYVSKGSLLFVLHGDRGPSHAAMDWPTRIKIIRGVAGGLAYIHKELGALDVPHGNLKSGNVLLSADYEPLLIDYGFIGLVNPAQVANLLFAYKSPEFTQHSYVCPKSDVYCLGIVILEVMTGKFPTQYLNNTQGGTDVVQWAASAVGEKREAELLDPHISGAKESAEDMVKVLRLGASCTESNPDKRPELKDVVTQMEEIARRSKEAVVVVEERVASSTTPAAAPAPPPMEAAAPPATVAAPPEQTAQSVNTTESPEQAHHYANGVN